ncbi:MAG: hypothetical protein K6B44_11195 [Lachnospiraceae bacterium]|nr:hypothetical protein [Lachnospiraceae bacterium]
MEMDKLYITHYYYPGTDPWKNIMDLPEDEAFRMAEILANAHRDTTSFGRFADFENYYPARKKADAFVREQFVKLGGNPRLQHPYSFTLMECEYLRKWFDSSDKIIIALEDIPDDQISFTLGDSCAMVVHGNEPEVLTKKDLLERIETCNGSTEVFFKESLGKYAYVEAQLWDRMEE